MSVAVLPAASLYAAVKSSFACVAMLSLTCCVPVNMPGGKPPTEVPGLNAKSPVILVAPVLVIPEPARTAMVDELPSDTRAGLAV